MPPQMPKSASLDSPGPLTTQPITATFTSRGMSSTSFSTSLAREIKSMLVRPQVGQDTTSTPPFRKPRVRKICLAERISSTGSPVRETRIVSPMPWCKISPRPMADLMFPRITVPASVMPTCNGYGVRAAISSWAATHINTSEDLMLMTRLS